MTRSIWLALAAALALAACARDMLESGPVDARFERQVAAVRLDPQATLAALNAYRSSHGVKPVRLDPELTAMAERQADGMAARGELSHNAAGPFSAPTLLPIS